jgi:hypothetical protein
MQPTLAARLAGLAQVMMPQGAETKVTVEREERVGKIVT